MPGLRNPPPEQPVRTYPTPDITDQVLLEWVTSETASATPLEPGSDHPNQREFAGFKLGKQEVNPRDPFWFIRYWVIDQPDPDFYNYSIKYSSESNAHQILIRAYRELKDGYVPRTKGTALDDFPGAILVSEEAQQFPQTSEYFANYFNVIRVYETLPGPILTSTEFERDGIKKVVTKQRMLATVVVTEEDLTGGILTHRYEEAVDSVVSNQVVETITVDSESLLDDPEFSVSIPNVIPEIFRALIPTRTEGHIVPGEATAPTLGFGEFERSERQLHPLYKEVRFTVLDSVALPYTISGLKETDADKQVVDISMTLELDTATPSLPDATTDVEFKKLGNGMAVEIIRTVPEVFPRDSYTKSILNLIPEKLRATIPTFESTIDEPGAPSVDPILLTGELSRTESRLTEFTKRTRITSLGAISVPVSISATETRPDKQVATTTWTLELVGTSIVTPTSTLDVAVEDLGNGYEVQTVTTVPEVFKAGSYTKTILNLIPPELRATVPTTETDETSDGIASTDPTLLSGELSRNEEQVNEFTKRVRITSLGAITVPISITALETDRDKQIVSIVYTLELVGTNAVVPTALIDVEVKDLGNGYEVVTTRTIPTVFDPHTYTKSILNLIPERLRATVATVEADDTSIGTASTNPTLLTGELSRSETQVSEFVMRIRTTSLGDITVPVSISETKTRPDKQIETIVYTLELVGTSVATPNSTTDVAVEDLGNGYEVQTVATVPEVFKAGSYTKTVLNLIPPELRAAVPTTETDETSVGTASADPTLLTGELSRNEEQVNEFTKRVRITSLGAITVPVSITALETDKDKQIVSIVYTLENVGTNAVVPTALIDVEVKDLGNGYEVATTRTIPTVFDPHTYSKSILNLIPERLRATVATVEADDTSIGTASTDPTLLTGELSRSETQVSEFVMRIRTTSLGDITVPVSVSRTETTRDKQVATIVDTLELTGTSSATPSSIQDVDVIDLGNGYEVETVTMVPDVFVSGSYTKTVENLIPAELRAAVPTVETDETSAGTASTDPTLLTGELSRNEEQVNEFTMRVRIRSLGSISVPVSITALETNQDKQIVSIVYTLELVGTNAVVPTALIDVAVKDLGNGYEVATIRTIDSVFPANTYSKSILNLIPPEFRAVVPTVESDVTSEGTASTDPTLLTGELSRSETQVSEFVMRVRTTSFGNVVLPITLTGGEKIVEKFGLQLVADEVITLAYSGTTSIPTGSLVIDAAIKEIGAGMEILTTLVVADAAWPIIPSRLWDENMRVEYDETNQIVAVGSAEDPDPGGVFAWTSEVRGIDQWHARKTNVNKPSPPYTNSTTALVTYDFRPFKFPGTVDVILAYNSGAVLGNRETKAELVLHTIRTWWQKSATTPTVTFDEIITDSVTITTAGLTTNRTFQDVLHDGFYAQWLYATEFFPATTPSFTEYYKGTDAGTFTNHNQIVAYTIGTGYTVGDNLTIGLASIQITGVGIAGSIFNFNVTDEGVGGTYLNPVTATGGTGTGATFNVTAYTVPDYVPGSQWIGTERIVHASVTPEREKDIWRISTESVTMR